MAWVFISIAVGAAGFLIYIVIDYLRFAGGMKPKSDRAKVAIRDSEAKIGAEQNATNSIKQQVAALQREVEASEKQISEMQRQLDGFKEKERRAKPTKHKVETDRDSPSA